MHTQGGEARLCLMPKEISEFTIGLVQMEIVAGDFDSNVSRAADHIGAAARSGVEMVVLPELWTSGYALDRAAELASVPGEGAFAAMQQLALEKRLWVAGSILEQENRRVYNTMIVCDPTGCLVATYRKTHLFGLMDEPRSLAAGDVPVMLDLPFGRTGLAICYDLRFPKLFAAYVSARCEAFLLCAEWPNPRLDHWRTLLRARAIESQAFVIACNRVGGSGTTFFGHSMIVDPWGDVVVEGDESEGVVVGRIDRTRLSDIRSRFPFLTDDRSFDVVETSSVPLENRC